jgi:hypothetical protein
MFMNRNWINLFLLVLLAGGIFIVLPLFRPVPDERIFAYTFIQILYLCCLVLTGLNVLADLRHWYKS